MDLVATMDSLPKPGETVSGSLFTMVPGGKGANQAVAAARLGSKVNMVGKLGQDDFADRLRQNLQSSGVNVDHITPCELPTGTAFVLVERGGENSIVVIAGANSQCLPEDIDKAKERIAASEIILLQLEIPIETVLHAAKLGRDLGSTVILDPAPAQQLPPEIWSQIDIAIPNETELSAYTGMEVTGIESAITAGRKLIDRGCNTLVVKLGKQGALILKDQSTIHIPAFTVDTVDTTAAGDAFAGALAHSLLQGNPLPDAVQFANAVGALTTTKLGAQDSLPWEEAVRAFLANTDLPRKEVI
ncbi:MAG: ribokinase [Firmicutes bacterium]|nr:ribokinase [Bacillota bacterium]